MSSLQPHPHVVKLIGCCIEKGTSWWLTDAREWLIDWSRITLGFCLIPDPSLIVLEYLVYGDLLGYLRKSRGIEDTYNTGEKGPSSSLREKDLLSFAWMIADGMNYLASMKVTLTFFTTKNEEITRNLFIPRNSYVCKRVDIKSTVWSQYILHFSSCLYLLCKIITLNGVSV